MPPYAATSGTEAVELAASVGLELDPWQQLVLREALGERPDGRWSAFEVGLIVPRQNGKGSILEALTLAGLFLFGEKLILHSAHEFKTAQEAFRRVRALVDDSDDLRKKVKRITTSHGEEGIELTGGQRLRFVARSTGSGRGFTGDRVILDEAYYLKSEMIAALLPTLSARPNPQIWYTSSAGMDISDQLRRVRDRGRKGGSPGLAYFEWSCEDSTALDDRCGWAQANPALGIRITDEFVALERDAMGGGEFARERLGIWQEAGGEAVIDLNAWADLADRDSVAADPVAFCVDANPERSAASIGVAGRRGDGRQHVEVVDHRPGTGWVVDRMVDLIARWKPCAVVVDGAGPAGSLIGPLEAAGVEVVRPSARDVTQACGQFYDAVAEQDLAHLDQGELNSAVSGARRRPLGDAWAWTRQGLSVDISPLVAVTLAAWGYTSYAHLHGEIDVAANVW